MTTYYARCCCAICLSLTPVAAAAAAAACDVPYVTRERSLAARTVSPAADRLSACPVADQLCRGLPVVVESAGQVCGRCLCVVAAAAAGPCSQSVSRSSQPRIGSIVTSLSLASECQQLICGVNTAPSESPVDV